MMHGAVTIITKVMAMMACIVVLLLKLGSANYRLQQEQFPLFCQGKTSR
jgi:hypothetical protein